MIHLTNQSFKESGGLSKYPNLDIAETVQAILSDEEISGNIHNLARLNNLLSRQAEALNSSHVFAIRYRMKYIKWMESSVVYAAIGTAYR